MAICNVIQRSQLEGSLRIEAEFYKPEDLSIVDKLRSLRSKEFNYYCVFVKKGIFDLPPTNYSDVGIPLIRTTEIKSLIADLSSVVRIPLSVHNNNIKTQLEAGDIVFTKIGANIGDVSILPSSEKFYNFSQNVAGAKINHNRVHPQYLACFFSTRYGKSQIKRIQMLSGQGKLELIDIKKLLVPPATDSLQKKIAELYDAAENSLLNSKRLYTQAEQLLLSELGLQDWKPQHTLTYVRNYSQAARARRMDAEHFQPKYAEIVEHISAHQPQRLSKLATQTIETIRFDSSKTYRYIEISDVNTSNGEVGYTEREVKDLPPNAKIKVKGGELIVSKVRPTRGAIGIVPDDCQDNGVCSSAFRLYPVLWTHQKVCILHQTNGGVSWNPYNEENLMLNSKWKRYGSF